MHVFSRTLLWCGEPHVVFGGKLGCTCYHACVLGEPHVRVIWKSGPHNVIMYASSETSSRCRAASCLYLMGKWAGLSTLGTSGASLFPPFSGGSIYVLQSDRGIYDVTRFGSITLSALVVPEVLQRFPPHVLLFSFLK